MTDKSSRNDTKKKVENDESLSDSDGSVPDIECETCGVSFPTVKNYEAHMQGKKHHKKVAEAKYKAKNQAISKKRAENEHDEEEDDDSDEVCCEVCDKNFSSYISYASHIKGSLHAKNLKKEKLKEQQKDLPEVIHGENDSDDDDFLLKPYAKCDTCQKQFSGPQAFKSHMKSSAHQKKVKQSGVLQKLKSALPDGEKKGSDDDDDEEFYKKCDTCQKSFSGVVPYQNHMFSKNHQKNLERKKVAEEIKEFYDSDDGYICKECKKSFTDPLAFKSHQKNNSHEKQKAKAALAEFLNDHPEIEFVIPSSKEGDSKENESDSDEWDSTYYLICKLCHFSFSGPESAQDHVKSKKHVSQKKEKKMLKLLKQQKKSTAKSDVQTSKSSGNSPASAKSKSPNGNVYSVEDFEMI